MSFSSSMQKTADRLTKKYGDDITLVDVYDCVYDPTTGDNTCTRDEYEIKGTVSAYTIQESGDSTTVNVDDLRVLIEVPFEVSKTFEVIYKNETYEIINIVKTRSQNATIVQALQIRGNPNG